MASNTKHPDYYLLFIVALLVVFGILILSSVSANYSFEKYGNTYYILRRQSIFLLIGLFLAYLAYRINLNIIKKLSPLLLLFGLIILSLVFVPGIGSRSEESLSAARWIGWGQYSFQPSEFLKLFFILYLASLLGSRIESNKKASLGKTLIPFFVVLFIIGIALFYQPNLSTLGIIALTGLIIYSCANIPLWQPIIAGFILLAFFISIMILAPYRMDRLKVFFNPDQEPQGIGYQSGQALIAVGSGGIMGVGLGMGNWKLGFLPQTISDSIFAVYAEESGFIGALILVLLFLSFSWAGFRIAKRSENGFFRLTSIGITSWIIIQAFVNIGAMIGILPLTGIPLPFIGYGGSALITELIAMGVLLNISKNL